MNALSNADLWAMVVAFFSPHIIAVVQQPTWPRWARACVTVAASILIGVGGSYFGGTLFGPSGRPALTVGVVLGAIVVSTTAYEHLFKGAAQKIELATSKSPIGKGSMGATAPAVGQPVTLQVGDTTLDATIKATPKHARAKK